MLDIIKAIESEQIRTDLPQFNVGDTVKVHVRVKEGNRERIQILKALFSKDKTEELEKHLQ